MHAFQLFINILCIFLLWNEIVRILLLDREYLLTYLTYFGIAYFFIFFWYVQGKKFYVNIELYKKESEDDSSGYNSVSQFFWTFLFSIGASIPFFGVHIFFVTRSFYSFGKWILLSIWRILSAIGRSFGWLSKEYKEAKAEMEENYGNVFESKTPLRKEDLSTMSTIRHKKLNHPPSQTEIVPDNTEYIELQKLQMAKDKELSKEYSTE